LENGREWVCDFYENTSTILDSNEYYIDHYFITDSSYLIIDNENRNPYGVRFEFLNDSVVILDVELFNFPADTLYKLPPLAQASRLCLIIYIASA
jgi:hypothetical protein